MTQEPAIAMRPQPIRDAIAAYLTEPRFARDIALHIRRSVPTTTGHLAAMRRRCLVKRIDLGVYALIDCTADPPPRPARSGPSSVSHRSLARLLTKPIRAEALCTAMALPLTEVYAALDRLWLVGLVTVATRDFYCLTAAGRHAFGVSVPQADTPPPRSVVSVPGPARAAASRAACARIAPLLTWRRSIQGLSLETGIRTAAVAAALDGLCLLGLVSGDAGCGFLLTPLGARKYAAGVAVDAASLPSRTQAIISRAVRSAPG